MSSGREQPSVSLEGELARFITSAPHAVALFDAEMRYVAASERWRADYGLTDRELVGKCHYDLFPELPERWKEIHRRCLAGAILREEEDAFVRADGRTQWLRWEVQPWRTPAGTVGGLVIFAEDVTERVAATHALRESEERLREMASAIHEVFWLTDPAKHQMLYVSPAYETIWGRPRASILEDARTWAESIEPEDRDRVWHAATTKQAAGTYDEEYRIRRPDGSIRWIRDRAFPVRDANGAVYRIAGVADDVTERRALADRLQQAQKMEAIGQLAGGVAHDFNNLLSVIGGNARLARDAASRDEATELLDEVVAAADRAARLTRQLLLFGRRGAARMVDLDLNETVLRSTELLRRLVPANVTLEVHLAEGLRPVRADASMIEQIIFNLAINARDAMPAGGRLLLATEQGDRAAVLVAEDSGTGIAPEHRDRIFEPFFTTKEVGAGTGLGLATVYGIVEQHGGSIELDTELGRGTSFRITLPFVTGSEAPRSLERGVPSVTTPLTGTILVVEDEPALRKLARRVLAQVGCQVHVAADAAEALAIWREHADGIDLVLTDIIMPGALTGSALAARLVEEKPTLAVVFTSGYAAESVAPALALVDGSNFLPKPYDPARLLAIVHRALEARRVAP